MSTLERFNGYAAAVWAWDRARLDYFELAPALSERRAVGRYLSNSFLELGVPIPESYHAGTLRILARI